MTTLPSSGSHKPLRARFREELDRMRNFTLEQLKAIAIDKHAKVVSRMAAHTLIEAIERTN